MRQELKQNKWGNREVPWFALLEQWNNHTISKQFPLPLSEGSAMKQSEAITPPFQLREAQLCHKLKNVNSSREASSGVLVLHWEIPPLRNYKHSVLGSSYLSVTTCLLSSVAKLQKILRIWDWSKLEKQNLWFCGWKPPLMGRRTGHQCILWPLCGAFLGEMMCGGWSWAVCWHSESLGFAGGGCTRCSDPLLLILHWNFDMHSWCSSSTNKNFMLFF